MCHCKPKFYISHVWSCLIRSSQQFKETHLVLSKEQTSIVSLNYLQFLAISSALCYKRYGSVEESKNDGSLVIINGPCSALWSEIHGSLLLTLLPLIRRWHVLFASFIIFIHQCVCNCFCNFFCANAGWTTLRTLILGYMHAIVSTFRELTNQKYRTQIIIFLTHNVKPSSFNDILMIRAFFICSICTIKIYNNFLRNS